MIHRILITLSILMANQMAFASEVVSLGSCAYKLSVATSASKKTVWRLWDDVENWKKYDTILEYSYLVDDALFVAGAVGYVKARGAPKTKFELLEVNPGVSFVESLKLPLFSSLLLKRRFEASKKGTTIFTHEVEFKGSAKYLMCLIMARTFKKELPRVMHNLRDLAEAQEAQSQKEEPVEPQLKN